MSHFTCLFASKLCMHTWFRDHTHRLCSVDMAEAEEETKTLWDLFSPITINPPSCIVLPATTAYFELKPHVIQLLPNFHGLNHEDPYMHIKDFLEICDTFKFQNFSDESVRLHLFPFSFKDKEKAWLKSLSSRSITTSLYGVRIGFVRDGCGVLHPARIQ